MKCPVLQEVFPYRSKIGGHCLSLWLIAGASYYAIFVQAPMSFHGYFANGKEILIIKGVRMSIPNPDDACITKIVVFLARQENPGSTLFSSTRGTTASMRECFGICGRVELQNTIYIRDI